MAMPAPKHKDGIRETLMTVLYAVLIAIVVRTVAYEPFNIPSGSMKPTLLVGDYLFVSKFSYGYSRHSLPFSLPLLPEDRVFFSEPERGDVVVFKKPSNHSINFIKRIIGLPGDKIQVKGGILHINGTAVERKRVESFKENYVSGGIRSTTQYIETLPNGREHMIIELNDVLDMDNTVVYDVPEDHYFVMGDNRDDSHDSRWADVGPIPKENLMGRAEILFFSIDGTAWKFWNWPTDLRFGRLFNGIE